MMKKMSCLKMRTQKFKSYITRQFKKFMNNANVKANDKDCKQHGFSQSKTLEIQKRIKESGKGSNITTGSNAIGVKGMDT